MRQHRAPRTPESVSHFAALIYSVCHGRQDLFAAGAPAPGGDEALSREFGARLSMANCGVGPEHDDWTVCTVEPDDRLAVALGGLMLWIDPRPGAALGERVRVCFPKEYRNLYPGHYVAIGDADRGALSNPLRLYWNIGANGADQLVRCVTEKFNRLRVPFRLKVLNDPAAYRRADAAILYIPPEGRREGAALVREVYVEMRSWMCDAVSAFVLPLAPGLGLAEDPPDSSSFGTHRSRLIAPLLYDALDRAQPLAAVAESLEAVGYRPDRFYMNPSSSESYDSFRVDVE